MKEISCLIFLLLTIAFLCFVSCGEEDSSSDFGDDQTTVNDDDDDDSALPMPKPLYAAAGQAIITPTAENHPETIYLGGIFPPRLASGVHDDLLVSALMLRTEDAEVVLVSLDFLGFPISRIRDIQRKLTEYGFEQDHILISSTHTHEAPDTLGVFGPNVLTSGVSRSYMNFVIDTVVNLVLSLHDRLEPVTMQAAKVQINDPGSNYPTLTGDFRIPQITVDFVAAARFIGQDGMTVGTLVNWHSHPEVMIDSTLITPDFPRWLRLRIEEQWGGSAVYISGAVGGLATPTGVYVPARDEDGQPMEDRNGNPLYLEEGSWDKARSLGYVVAEYVIEGLTDAPEIIEPELFVHVQPMLLPVNNPIMILANLVGILEFDNKDLVKNRPDICGWYGCSDERIGLVKVGPVELITSPGETFPETLVGRDGLTYDFGGDWGEFDFPPMRGIVEAMTGDVPMHMALCGNEIGYLIPEADFHPNGHPDYYEEELYLGKDSETVYRSTVFEMLGESLPPQR